MSAPGQDGRAALGPAVARLRAAGVANPERDARLLLAHALGIAPDRLLLHLDAPMPAAAAQTFAAAVAARAQRQPVSQIVGERQFWGRWFSVTRDVLDPRPETETLVAAALEGDFDDVLDLGTGSGAILLSLLAERPDARGLGVDLSEPALAVARGNAVRHALESRATFAISDWFTQVAGRFDLIVSNPPYVAESEMAGLDPETRDWEPMLALTPGGDGLAAYRRIAAGAGGALRPGGRLLLEIGPTQGAQVSELLAGAGFADPVVLRDMDGRPRVVAASLPHR
ncbi:MAG: release factor glutamine methyltransferase HemK [Rhodobacteraceae bacterium HLUCCA12]|nr:MAG: release factor glutamine methyltransferase HemK [Rhodobacteraceae bacterium HLUCCA12]